MHHAMPAKPVGKKETRNFRRFAENWMMVRRHFIKPRPGALRIDRNIFEYRHTIGSAGEDLLNKARLEVSLVTRSLVWIIPCQQESAALRAEVKAGGHIDDHGR